MAQRHPGGKRGAKSGTTNAAARDQKQREADRVFIESLMIQGHSYRAIAVKLGEVRPYSITSTTVRTDGLAIRAEWKAQRLSMMDNHVEAELVKLDKIESEAWDAWERSKRDAVRKKVERETTGKGKRKGEKVKQSATTEGRDGDPRYLAIIADVSRRRAALLGLDAPTRVASVTPDGDPAPTPQQGPLVQVILNGIGEKPVFPFVDESQEPPPGPARLPIP